MNDPDEKENLFRDSLQHFGFARYCEPILVMTRDISEKKFRANDFSRRGNSYILIIYV